MSNEPTVNTPPPDDDAGVWETKALVCYGREIFNGALHVVLAEVLVAGGFGAPGYYEVNKNTRRLFAGAVYSIEANEAAGKLRVAAGRYRYMYPDKELVAGWQAKTRAAENEL